MRIWDRFLATTLLFCLPGFLAPKLATGQIPVFPGGNTGGGTTTCATTTNLLAGNGSAGGCADSTIAPANVALLTGAAFTGATSITTATNLGFSVSSSSTANTTFSLINTNSKTWIDLVTGSTAGTIVGGRCLLDSTDSIISICWDGSGNARLNSTTVLGWGSASPSASATPPDTGLSRDAAGVVDCGNGTQGNKSCTFNAAKVNSPIAGAETIASSATPAFTATTRASITTLTANITSFTLAAGTDGQEKTLTFCQNATGSFTLAGVPSNVRGLGTIGATASKCSSQHLTYYATPAAWLADATMVTNE